MDSPEPHSPYADRRLGLSPPVAGAAGQPVGPVGTCVVGQRDPARAGSASIVPPARLRGRGGDGAWV